MKVFVDTAPVMEKPLAQEAGLGWQGKHTNLVSREFGSWLFLGSIFTTLEMAPDAAGDRSLRQMPCLPRCLSDRGIPGALSARCAALHFLSHHRAQGTIAREFRDAMGNRIYGCDDCLAVCPGTIRPAAQRGAIAARAELATPRLADLAGWTMRAFASCSASRRSSASAATVLSAMS